MSRDALAWLVLQSRLPPVNRLGVILGLRLPNKHPTAVFVVVSKRLIIHHLSIGHNRTINERSSATLLFAIWTNGHWLLWLGWQLLRSYLSYIQDTDYPCLSTLLLPSLLLWSARDQISLLTRIALGMILVSKSLFVVGSSIDQSAFKHHSLTDSLTAGRRQSNENEAPITTKTGLRVENGTELQSRYTKTLKFHFVFLWCSLNHCGRGIR